MNQTQTAPRANRTICIYFCQEQYAVDLWDPVRFREKVDRAFNKHPELFPAGFEDGYKMKDFRTSKKLNITYRRITFKCLHYTIRPCFVMPYMAALVKDVEKPLFLRKHAVSFCAITYCFGKNPMFWYRLETALGRNSLVGTTIKSPEKLPDHLIADEKHTRIMGVKSYIATTVSDGCIVGACVSKSAGNKDLEKSYGVFQKEAQLIKPDYAPKTVNTDGWEATKTAWSRLYPSAIILSCFLHVFLGIRDRISKKCKDIFRDVSTMLWDCYNAKSKASFSQRVRRLYEWSKKSSLPEVIKEKVAKFRRGRLFYSAAYDHPDSYRTSNMLDRLMQPMDRYLFNTQYFHGSIESSTLNIRGWALIQNFAPFNKRTQLKYNDIISPSEKFNGFRYHTNWLQNLLISASLGGYRSRPPNP